MRDLAFLHLWPTNHISVGESLHSAVPLTLILYFEAYFHLAVGSLWIAALGLQGLSPCSSRTFASWIVKSRSRTNTE